MRAALTGLEVPVIAAWADKRDGLTEKQQTYLTAFLDSATRGYAGLRPDSRDGTIRWADADAGADGVETAGLAAAVARAVGAEAPKGVMALAYRTPPDPEATPFRIFPAHLVKVLPEGPARRQDRHDRRRPAARRSLPRRRCLSAGAAYPCPA